MTIIVDEKHKIMKLKKVLSLRKNLIPIVKMVAVIATNMILIITFLTYSVRLSCIIERTIKRRTMKANIQINK